MEQTTKGIFLKNLIDAVKKRKGPEGIKLLEEKFGSLHFSLVKSYPIEMEVRLHEAAVETLYQGQSDKAHFEFGRIGFKTYAESIIGKTMLLVKK